MLGPVHARMYDAGHGTRLYIIYVATCMALLPTKKTLSLQLKQKVCGARDLRFELMLFFVHDSAQFKQHRLNGTVYSQNKYN